MLSAALTAISVVAKRNAQNAVNLATPRMFNIVMAPFTLYPLAKEDAIPLLGVLTVVRAQHRSINGSWYSGRVTCVHDDGTMDVAYDDGDRESKVPPNRIKTKSADGSWVLLSDSVLVPLATAKSMFSTVAVLLKACPMFLLARGTAACVRLFDSLSLYCRTSQPAEALALWELLVKSGPHTVGALEKVASYRETFTVALAQSMSSKTKVQSVLRIIHSHCVQRPFNHFNIQSLLDVANRYKDNADVLDALFRVCTDAVNVGHANDVAEKMMPLVPRLFTNADFAGPIDAAVGMLAAIAASGSATACKDLFTYCKTTLMPLLLQPPDTVRGSTFVSICEVVASLGDADQTFVKTTLADPMFISTYAQRVWDRTRADNLRGDVVQGPLSLLAYTLTPQDDESADTKAVAEDVRAKLRTGEAVRHIISVMPSPGATHKVALRMLQALASDDDGAKEVETALELLKPKVHPWNSVGDAPLASVLLPVAQRPGGAERVKSVMTESKLKSWSSNCPAAADAEKKKWTDLLKLVSEDPA